MPRKQQSLPDAMTAFLSLKRLTQALEQIWTEQGRTFPRCDSVEFAPDLWRMQTISISGNPYYALDLIGHPNRSFLIYLREWVMSLTHPEFGIPPTLAAYRLVLALFFEQGLHHLDFHKWNITQGDPVKKAALDELLSWLVIYPELEWIRLHPEDGEIPLGVQAVLSQHRALHGQWRLLNDASSWKTVLALLPRVTDSWHQSLRASYWLLHYLAKHMVGRPISVEVAEWELSLVELQNLVSEWPEIFNRVSVPWSDRVEWVYLRQTMEAYFEGITNRWQSSVEQCLAVNSGRDVPQLFAGYFGGNNKRQDDWRVYQQACVQIYPHTREFQRSYIVQYLTSRPEYAFKRGWIYLHPNAEGRLHYSLVAMDGREIIDQPFVLTDPPAISMTSGSIVEAAELRASVLSEAIHHKYILWEHAPVSPASVTAPHKRGMILDRQLAEACLQQEAEGALASHPARSLLLDKARKVLDKLKAIEAAEQGAGLPESSEPAATSPGFRC